MIAHGIDYSRTKRRRFTISDRLAIVRNVRRHIATGESIRGACKALNIIPKQYREWSKSTEALTGHRNPNAKSTAPGNDSTLKPIEQDLLRFIFEHREQGIAVSISLVAIQAARLMPEFKEKPSRARYQSVRRWIRKHGLVHRMGIHECQRTPSETSGMARDYVQTIRPRLSQSNRHQDFLLNMDQTPIPFTFHAKKTIESVGVRTVHIRKSTNDTKRVTCAMTVSASGKVLTPLLVFKGAPNGRIEKKEFGKYPPDMEYACQANAWMDERVMHLWIDKVLKPYVDQAPPGVVPLLLLDSYRCHMMKAIVNAIEDLGVEVEHIPGGCTSLCQPVDVGVNKPFKSRMRNLWEEWMISTALLNGDGKIKPPTRKDIAEWCSMSSKDLPERMVQNAWRHGEYSYFPPPPPPVPVAAAVFAADNSDDDNSSHRRGGGLRVQATVAAAIEERNDDSSSSDDVEPFVRRRSPRRVHAAGVAAAKKNDDDRSSSSDDDSSGYRRCVQAARVRRELLAAVATARRKKEEQGATYDEEESTSNDEDNSGISDDDDDDGEVLQSEPLLSCAYQQQPDQNADCCAAAGGHVDEDAAGTVVDNENQSSSLPPLPDTMDLQQILQEHEYNRSE